MADSSLRSGHFVIIRFKLQGLRWSVLVTLALVAAGTAVRCITSEPPYVTWLAHTGQFLNGLGGPVACAAPPVLSAVWFPAHQRTTSTAVATMFHYLGVAISFLIGPLIVTDSPRNKTNPQNSSWSHEQLSHNQYNGSNATLVKLERQEIMKLMYIECGWAVLLFLVALIYFPARPKIPPSVSAHVERMDFCSGVKALLRNWRFWMIAGTYGVSTGISGGWSSVLNVNLESHNISQDQAAWIGFYSTISSIVACLILARFADIFSRHMRLFLLGLYGLSTLASGWFALMSGGILPTSLTLAYVSIISQTVFLNSAVPLFFELACEVTHPIAEGITNGVVTLLNNIAGLVFLLIFLIPNIGTAWMNWFLFGSIASCMPVLFLMGEQYNRMAIDKPVESDKEEHHKNG